MSLDVEPKQDTRPSRSPWRWVAAVVAAAVVVVAVVASLGAFGSDDKSPRHPAAGTPQPTVTVTAPTPSGSQGASASAPAAKSGKVTQLSVAADQSRCVPPTSAFLAKHASLAFEGKVTSIAGKAATLQVSNWMYADGFGGTDTVRIALPAQTTELMPQFQKGKDYLVAAGSDSKVLGCGYTDVKGPSLQKMYAGAFK